MVDLTERWAREVTDKRIRCDTFLNVPALINALKSRDANTSTLQHPKVIVLASPAAQIFSKIAECKDI